MTTNSRIAIAGWVCSLVGLLVVLQQITSHGPEWQFVLGFGLMIGGTVLRLFGRYGSRR